MPNSPEHTELLAQMSEKIGKIVGTLDGMKDTQDKIYKAIYGNGQAGLTQRVSDLENKQASNDGAKISVKERRALWATLIATLGVVVGIAYHVLTIYRAIH